VSEALQNLAIMQKEIREDQKEIIKCLQEARTECKSMSDVTQTFASQLLGSLGISWSYAPSDETQGVFHKFSWEGGEEQNTVKAVSCLRKLLKGLKVSVQGGLQMPVEIQDVHSLLLVPVKGDHKQATGKTDALIRVCQPEIDDNAKFAWALCAVEFKTDKVKLDFFQQLLELVSITYMSDYRQGAVLLGTDLNNKWQIMYFDRPNHIVCQTYKYGSVAIKELKHFLASASERLADLSTYELSCTQPSPLLAVHAEEEQNLDGYHCDHDRHADAVQAIQNLTRKLQNLLNVKVCAPLALHIPRKPAKEAPLYMPRKPTREAPFGMYG